MLPIWFKTTTMDIAALKKSLQNAAPPADVSVYVKALWYDAKDNWGEAHKLIQDIADKNASWVHAYLHRKEGDTGNADYWYAKAGKRRPFVSLDEEWQQIATAFLNGNVVK